MKRFLECSAALLCLALIPCVWMVATETASTLRQAGLAADAIAQVPQMAEARLAALQTSVDTLPPLVAKLGMQIAESADTQITSLRADVMARVDKIEQDANTRTGEALALVDQRTKVLDDVKPVLANTAALVKDAQDSLDDLYPDIKAVTESATVAVTSAAQASEAVRDAAPKVVTSVVSIGQSAEGIASAGKREADELTKPQNFRQKVFTWLGLIPRIVRVVL